MEGTNPSTAPDAIDRTTLRDTVSVYAASVALGITEDAVRARLRRGVLAGEKRGTAWVVDRSALEAVIDGDATRHDVARSDDTTSRDTIAQVTRHNATPAVDLAPLADLIERQGRELAEAREAAAMWQARAMHLDEQMKQLTAIVGEPDQPAGSASWWRRVEHHPAVSMVNLSASAITLVLVGVPLVGLVIGAVTRDVLLVIVAFFSLLSTVPILFIPPKVLALRQAGRNAEADRFSRIALPLVVVAMVLDVVMIIVLGRGVTQ